MTGNKVKKIFLKFVKDLITEIRIKVSQIINMDEVPLMFDCLPNQAIDKTDKKSISIMSTGHKKIFYFCAFLHYQWGEIEIPDHFQVENVA